MRGTTFAKIHFFNPEVTSILFVALQLNIHRVIPINWLEMYTTSGATLISSKAMPTNQSLHYFLETYSTEKSYSKHMQIIETTN